MTRLGEKILVNDDGRKKEEVNTTENHDRFYALKAFENLSDITICRDSSFICS